MSSRNDEKDAKQVRELYDALMNLSRKCDEMSNDDQLNEVEETLFGGQSVGYCNAAQMVKERLMNAKQRQELNIEEHNAIMRRLDETEAAIKGDSMTDEKDAERRYTAAEIEELLTIPCCHVSGTHDPTHYEDGRYICRLQIANAMDYLCQTLGINPKVKHKESCGWCASTSEHLGDGKEFWDRPHECAICGKQKYLHERAHPGRYGACETFVPCTFKSMIELRGEPR